MSLNIGTTYVLHTQIKRSDSAFYWEERDIMAYAGSDWIVEVRGWLINVEEAGYVCM